MARTLPSLLLGYCMVMTEAVRDFGKKSTGLAISWNQRRKRQNYFCGFPQGFAASAFAEASYFVPQGGTSSDKSEDEMLRRATSGRPLARTLSPFLSSGLPFLVSRFSFLYLEFRLTSEFASGFGGPCPGARTCPTSSQVGASSGSDFLLRSYLTNNEHMVKRDSRLKSLAH